VAWRASACAREPLYARSQAVCLCELFVMAGAGGFQPEGKI